MGAGGGFAGRRAGSVDDFPARVAPRGRQGHGGRQGTDSRLSRDSSTLFRHGRNDDREHVHIYGQGWAKLQDISRLLRQPREDIHLLLFTSEKHGSPQSRDAAEPF